MKVFMLNYLHPGVRCTRKERIVKIEEMLNFLKLQRIIEKERKG